MSDYSKPNFNNLPFRFTSGGYTAPDFGNIHFSLGAAAPTYQQTANLQAAINVMGVYQDTTYTYLKACPKIVVGYTAHGIQVLQLPCVYGGIRDLGASLGILPPNVDLPAYIFAVSNYIHLTAYIKSTIQATKDLPASAGGHLPEDLIALLYGFDTRDISGSLYGWAIKNLPAYIGAHPPADLQAIINVIEIRDLPALINGTLFSGYADLGAEFYKIWDRKGVDLQGTLTVHVIYSELDLLAFIDSISFRDLLAYIYSAAVVNLPGYLYSIRPVDLRASLQGYDTKNLPARAKGVYGPYDLRAYLTAIDAINLPASIIGWGGYQIPRDLAAYLDGYGPVDLTAIINPLAPADLLAYLTATGQSEDLLASIIPNTIRLKRSIRVSLLEHLDLKGLINFQCFSSDYSELLAYMNAIYMKDLRGFIWGWVSADGYGDIGSYINVGDYTVQDKLTINMISDPSKYTKLKITFSAYEDPFYYVFDKLPIYTTSYYKSDITAIVSGILRSVDLGASINVLYQPNYSELSPSVKHKRHETVIDFDEDWRENWRRYVELSFSKGDKSPYHYFYVSGAGQVYKLDRSRHWSISAKSYIKDEDNMIERRSIRNKSLSKLSSYVNMDAAVRDLVDRVAIPRRVDLSARISSIPPVHSDLSASLRPDVRYTWVKHLTGDIYGYGSVSADIGASIVGT